MGVLTPMIEGLSARKAESRTATAGASHLEVHRTTSRLGVRTGISVA